ncbi:integrase [Verminephrobacter aporrectodeae subsp. tuberculatae]|uniref:tyrosine-type recombinase/integrase n=1 Tax=Verminephrobacter aporrectodeae TaxID=1110389 RepID=UPI0002377E38|nr:tyrosine-type recombinase/integrase [Verminephrobacter aporrectodeae]MCW8209166.1 integrase [Verminephrobacter aporrectodeae subsp. tuberculatae]
MNAQLADSGAAINRFLLHVHPRSRNTVNGYRCILVEFQCHVQLYPRNAAISQSTIESWLRGCASRWPEHYVLHRARVVDRFLDFLASEESIPSNPLAQLRLNFGQRVGTPIVRALLSPDPAQALETLKPLPQFASVYGAFMRSHIELMRASGYRYNTQALSFLRFDRFLQGRADVITLPLTVLLQEWVDEGTTLHHAVERQQVARNLARAWQRIDPRVELPKVDRRLSRQRVLEQRRPYIYTPQEVRHLLETAREFPSPRSSLRPLTLYTMLVLAYCCGLRLGELARLNLGDVHVATGEIVIRETKFFKSRTLPFADSVMVALCEYLEARQRAGAPQDGSSGLFWHTQSTGRYSRVMTHKLLVCVLRRAGLKPESGRVGPRIHDLRHSMVVNRMLTWYREGINPQARLPFLATYLGHKDINSTLVYLTLTQELLQEASERFRAFAAHGRHLVEGATQ